MKSKHAQVHFNESGTPVADHFDDVYFLTTAELMKPNTFLLQATTLMSAGNSGATLLLSSPKQVLELG